MKHRPYFHETYLYKIHVLSNVLDKIFDQVLRKYANVTLSQFMILFSLSQYELINQRKLAHYLGLSAAAVKRQVDITKGKSWLVNVSQNKRGEALQLTSEGHAVVERGLQALEQHAFRIFDRHNHSVGLMQHIDTLLNNAKGVLDKK